jgi:hypothetical protein
MISLSHGASCSTRSVNIVTWTAYAENLPTMTWKNNRARNSVTTPGNLVKYSRCVKGVERSIWRRTLMLSSQWKKWCNQQKKVVVDYAGAFMRCWEKKVGWRSALEIVRRLSGKSRIYYSTPWWTDSNNESPQYVLLHCHLRATLGEGPRSRVQWNRTILFDKSHKLDPCDL